MTNTWTYEAASLESTDGESCWFGFEINWNGHFACRIDDEHAAKAITTACNSHDDLLAACTEGFTGPITFAEELRSIARQIKHYVQDQHWLVDAILERADAIESAVAKAGGEV